MVARARGAGGIDDDFAADVLEPQHAFLDRLVAKTVVLLRIEPGHLLGIYDLCHRNAGNQTATYLKRRTVSMFTPSMRIRRVEVARVGECRSPSL
ncbi:hypothetical protein D3C83_70540 [compost metagenome]